MFDPNLLQGAHKWSQHADVDQDRQTRDADGHEHRLGIGTSDTW